jgi:hypothetical protein
MREGKGERCHEIQDVACAASDGVLNAVHDFLTGKSRVERAVRFHGIIPAGVDLFPRVFVQ